MEHYIGAHFKYIEGGHTHYIPTKCDFILRIFLFEQGKLKTIFFGISN